MIYKEEFVQERLRPSSESGCIFKGDVVSKEEFVFGRERLFVKQVCFVRGKDWKESGSSEKRFIKNIFSSKNRLFRKEYLVYI